MERWRSSASAVVVRRFEYTTNRRLRSLLRPFSHIAASTSMLRLLSVAPMLQQSCCEEKRPLYHLRSFCSSTRSVGSNNFEHAQRDENEPHYTLSFYKYVALDKQEGQLDVLRKQLLREWGRDLAVTGRVYISPEGINAQVSVPATSLAAYWKAINARSSLAGIAFNFSSEENHRDTEREREEEEALLAQGNKPGKRAFSRLHIRIRPQIVTGPFMFEDPHAVFPNPNTTHLSVAQWHDAMQRPDATLVDIRNHYESEIGHFKNALKPIVDTYKESFPVVLDMLAGKKDAPVLLYCTGGIRCEKMAYYLNNNGFTDVRQLKGGIVGYTREAKQQNIPSQFVGKNFSFDDRLGERVTEEVIARCHQCGASCDMHTNCANNACSLLFIQCGECRQKHQGTCGDKECIDAVRLEGAALDEYLKQRAGTNNYFKKRIRSTLPFSPLHSNNKSK